MKAIPFLILLAFVSSLFGIVRADDKAAGNPAVFNRVRYYPATGHEQDMLGGKFLGSNISKTEGFELLAEIKSAPTPGQWTELTFPNAKVYRWIRYEAPPGSHGRVAKIEFYGGEKQITGDGFGSYSAGGFNRAVVDPALRPTSGFEGFEADGQYIGLDLGDAATSHPPDFNPGQGEFKDSVTVTLTSKASGAVIRYTTDGAMPTPDNGQVYSAPLKIDTTTTLSAAVFKKGKAPTRTAYATYIIGSAVPGKTFRLGNSLTGILRYKEQAYTAGYKDEDHSLTIGGGLTKTLWNAAMLDVGNFSDQNVWAALYNSQSEIPMKYALAAVQKCHQDWRQRSPAIAQIDNMVLQPRDFVIAEEADYDNRFINWTLQKSPNVQPWLYIEWTERQRQRPTDLGKEPTTEMTKVWPAATWEESMGAMILYGEDLKKKINETYKGPKPIRIIPAALAMGWMNNMIDHGKVPGIAKGDFHPKFFNDVVHANLNGVFLIDCTWYAAFHGESPEGKFLPILTTLTPEQARVMQRLAWDVVKNYPDCGYYEEGTVPVGGPGFSAGPAQGDATPMELTSTTPGAWFRYTLDGTTPTRTDGYVYCGIITLRPGMRLQAIAYKSGMADSPVAEYQPSNSGEK